MNLESKEFWLVTFGVIVSIQVAFLVFSRWCLHSPAVREEMFRELRVGMTREEVGRLLGKPFREIQVRDRAEWLYGHRLKSHVLRLHFDAEGRLRQYDYMIRSGREDLTDS